MTPAQVLRFLQDRGDEMLAALEELARLESPSLDPEAQEPLLDRLHHGLQQLGLHVLRFAGPRSGGHLLARPRRDTGQPAQLLIGHCDTVWPRGTLEQMPVRRDGSRLLGPGVYDMKGGLVQILFALRALKELDCRPEVAPYVLINSDEEVGSFESRRILERLAAKACRALVLEPSLGHEGRLKTARKGVSSYTITVHGRPAHAGLDPEAGASAILELSYVIQQLHRLNSAELGISVNVGLVQGGLRANVVAPQSRAVVDVRCPTHDDWLRVDAEIRSLRPTVPGVQLEIEGNPGRPPLEKTARNQALWRRARQLGLRLHLDLQEGSAGGGSDGSYTSLHCATLDGLGPVGGGAHASHEFVEIASLPQRAALLALLLLEPEGNGHERGA